MHIISNHIIYNHNIFNHDKHFSEADIPFSKTTQDDAWHIAYQHWPARGGTLAGLDVPDVSHVVNYSLGLSVPRRAECMHSKLFKLSWRFVIRECCWNCLGYLLVCPLWLINTRVASRDARVIFSWVFGLWSYTVNIDMIWKSNGSLEQWSTNGGFPSRKLPEGKAMQIQTNDCPLNISVSFATECWSDE